LSLFGTTVGPGRHKNRQASHKNKFSINLISNRLTPYRVNINKGIKRIIVDVRSHEAMVYCKGEDIT
jgi:hypothetical protein